MLVDGKHTKKVYFVYDTVQIDRSETNRIIYWWQVKLMDTLLYRTARAK